MAAAPRLTCVLLVETELKGWQKMLDKLTQDIEGLAFYIDAPDWWTDGEGNPLMVSKKLMHLRGEVDPMIFIKKLYKARTYAMLYRIDYGYEENPEGTRKPNQHFMRFVFKINMLEESWYKKVIGALKAIQGVSFTIHAPKQMGYSDAPSQEVFMCGNIEKGVLMKMYAKTGIHMMGVEYGQPPKKPEASADGTETQPTRDTEPPSREIVRTSTKHQTKYLSSIFRKFYCP